MAISVVAKLAGMLAMPAFATVCLAVSAGVTIGLVCHAFMEKPITSFLKNRRRPARRAHPVAAT
jgi:exopolysaccharide production protein ExoZ